MKGLTIHVDGYDNDIKMTYNTYHKLRSSIALSYCVVRDYNADRWFGPLVNDGDNPITQLFMRNDTQITFSKDEVKGIATILDNILQVDDDIIDYAKTHKDTTQLKEMRYIIINGKEHLQPFRPFKSITGKDDDTARFIKIIEDMINLFQYAEDNNMEVVYK